jgi:3-oxoacyl-[acyl-carrier-protein] synthase-3
MVSGHVHGLDRTHGFGRIRTDLASVLQPPPGSLLAHTFYVIWSRIVGTGGYLPERVVTNDELSRRLDTNDAWIRERTGISSRHIAATGQKTSDLALMASRRALQAARVAPTEIDLVIVATTTPDRIFPSTACVLQGKLGVRGCPAFDLQAACSGFVYALATADSFIRAGQARKVLVVGAETYSRIVNWNDRSTCILFGDGAGAVVLAADSRPGMRSTVLRADGSLADVLTASAAMAAGEIVGDPYVTMDGGSVFRIALRSLVEVARSTLAQSDLTASQLDWIVPHQANARIMGAVALALEIPPERMVMTIDQHGNTAAASVPLALDSAVRDGRIRSGHNVLLQSVGAGFTWGATLLEF